MKKTTIIVIVVLVFIVIGVVVYLFMNSNKNSAQITRTTESSGLGSLFSGASILSLFDKNKSSGQTFTKSDAEKVAVNNLYNPLI